MSLHVPSFAGGVVRTGSPDTQRTDEVLVADSLDIGPRGQLVCATDVSDYLAVSSGPLPAKEVYGLVDTILGLTPQVLMWGRGRNDAGNADVGFIASFIRSGAGSAAVNNLVGNPPVTGGLLSAVQFPGVFTVDTFTGSLVLLCLGAREGTYPKGTGLGIIALLYDVTGATLNYYGMSQLDALGTGPKGVTFPGGTRASSLFFRGIVGYNNHVFGWGFDAADGANGDGPARVMFCNPGDPRKWGNDTIASAGDRFFVDSDAIVLGDAGEIVRGALKWNGKLWFGTNQQLHYIAGFGRDSYLTDGANPVAKSYNIVGPRALIEGPDKLLYQVSDQGLVAFDGSHFEPHFKRLVDFAGHSSGYWDLIWTDPTVAAGFPGRTNQDLVWMAVDWDREQVLVGIPYCNATTGAGAGSDTVVIKFHTRSGGFTRQVFLGVAYSAAGYFRRQGQQREVRFLATTTPAKTTVQRYGYQATPTTSPVLPTRLPRATFGPYAPFGPDGDGVVRRAYLTLAWEATGSLPIVFTIATKIDDSANDSFTLSLQPTAPGSPANGDLWVDTSQTDTNLGNASPGVIVTANGGYLVKTWNALTSAWRLVPGSGEQGTRARVPLPLTRRKGARATIDAICTSAAGRFELEGLGLNPGGGTPDA